MRAEDGMEKDRLHVAARGDAPRKTYHPPQLVEYGSLEKLTHGGGGTMADAPAGATMSCL